MTTNIGRLFGSKTRGRVLWELIANADRGFYPRELSRRLNANYNGIYRELLNLEALGLIAAARQGNLRYFQINKKSPIYEELRKIFLKTTGLGEPLRKALEPFPIKFAMIFGSFASGSQIGESDVDLLIIGEAKTAELIGSVRKAEEKIGREINYIAWSQEELKRNIKQKHHLLLEIAEKPIIGIIGDPDEFRRAVSGKDN